MTEHDKISSDVKATVGSEQVAAPSQGRRRLVKGTVFAAPVVMTLYSGRLAAAASICACKDKLPLASNVPELIEGTDIYVRTPIQLEICTLDSMTYYYDASSSLYYQLSGGVFSTATPTQQPTCTSSFIPANKLVTSQNGQGNTVAMTPSCMISLKNQTCT